MHGDHRTWRLALLLIAGLLAAVVTPGTVNAAPSGQPYAPNWFPEELLNWSPGSDPDSAYNRSSTRLTPRVVDDQTAANPEAEARKVMALSVFANTDGNPSQGSATYDYYTSEFWQYIDTLVFWGGSSSEGLILAPNPTVTDAAHRNGVPVLGTVFLPPEAFGGKLEWTRQLLTRDDAGRFPAAAKLNEVARFYGFEGWFINAETEGGDRQLATDMRDFIKDLRSRGMRVFWYDSMIESGEIDWQNHLNVLNDNFFAESNTMFLNYGWDAGLLEASSGYAKHLGRSPSDLHAGIDVGAGGFTTQPRFDTLFPSHGATGLSAGLYRPDFTFSGTPNPSDYPARDSRFWVGSDNDPSTSTADADGWKGISSSVAEKTPITRLPFVSTFNTGRGRGWWMDGSRWQEGGWNNLTVQDVLPTWRWTGSGTRLAVGFDHDMAYRGGTSVRMRGALPSPSVTWLYATRLSLTGDERIAWTQHGRAEVSLVMRFADDPGTDVVVAAAGSTAQWNTRSTSLAEFEGRMLTRVGIRHTKPADVSSIDYRLGRFAITSGTATAPGAPSGVRVLPAAPGARVVWQPSSSPVMRYDVEAVTAAGVRTWLGSTTGTAYFAAQIPSGATSIEVVPVGSAHQRGTPGRAPLPTSARQ